MRHGQTNGIPQGAVLMDFIAEMVLGYSDIELAEKITRLNIDDYCILRYRDDYRIFVNNSQDGERILKCLTEVMMDLGLKLNPAKTKISNQVICSSIKDEKRSWICRRQIDKNLQKQLLIIHNHSIEYPNAGSLLRALGAYHKRILRLKKYDQAMPLISIIVDIAYHNPKVYAFCAAILSKLISFLETNQRQSVIEKTKRKFSQIPNTGRGTPARQPVLPRGLANYCGHPEGFCWKSARGKAWGVLPCSILPCKQLRTPWSCRRCAAHSTGAGCGLRPRARCPGSACR